jgi:hypothetical protein
VQKNNGELLWEGGDNRKVVVPEDAPAGTAVCLLIVLQITELQATNELYLTAYDLHLPASSSTAMLRAVSLPRVVILEKLLCSCFRSVLAAEGYLQVCFLIESVSHLGSCRVQGQSAPSTSVNIHLTAASVQ